MDGWPRTICPSVGVPTAHLRSVVLLYGTLLTMGSSSSLARGLYTDLEAGVRLASTHEVSMHVVAIYIFPRDRVTCPNKVCML